MADPNRTKTMKKETNDETGEVSLSFLGPDGKTIVSQIVVKLDQLQPGIVKRAALHGLAQKIGDAAAGKKGDEAHEASLTVYERIMGGEWAKPSEKGEGTRPSMIIAAIVRAFTKAGKTFDLEALKAKFTGEGSEELRKKALEIPQVKAEYETMKAEAAMERAAKAAEAAATAPSLSDL